MLFDKKTFNNQAGFSLVELMVGLVIGLIATLVIMQVFSSFEGQKRTTTGIADAQTNGSIGLFTMQRDIQVAGFGLPVFDTQNSPLLCNSDPTINHDGDATTPAIGLFPIRIVDGGAAGSDSIEVRYATDGANTNGGVTVKVQSVSGNIVAVDNNLGCNDNDVVLVTSGSTCAMTTINDTDLTTDTTHITMDSVAGIPTSGSLSCMGSWNQLTYTIADNQLLRNDATTTTARPIVSDIVNLQAQYGISATADSNVITSWVNASGATWGAPTVANRNLIKAVHVSIIARNGLLEKDNVTAASCTTAKGTVSVGPCAWDDSEVASAAPVVDLSADANWRKYRYRVYETIIPLRNMIWSKNTL